MANVVTLEVFPRETSGTKAARRLRREGIVPANVYGHDQPPRNVQIPADSVKRLLQSGVRVVDLTLNGATQKTLLSDVQWDTFGQHILHVDFLRVDANERVEVKVPVHTRGTAPGVLAGGILEQPHHELTVDCLAVEIPQEIVVRIHSLDIGGVIHVRELTDLPDGVKILENEDEVVLQIIAPTEPTEEEEAEGAAEPEVVGKKGDEAGEA